MSKIMVSIKDTAAQTFGQPWFVNHVNEAIRAFTDEVNRPGSKEQPNNLYSHPSDFELYEIGVFDDADGSVYGVNGTTTEKPGTSQLLVRGKDVSRRNDVEPTPHLRVAGGTDDKSVVI